MRVGTKLASGRFAIVQPYTDRADRLARATVVSTHATAAAALAELKRIAERIHGFNIPDDAIEILVVDAERRRVARGIEEGI